MSLDDAFATLGQIRPRLSPAAHAQILARVLEGARFVPPVYTPEAPRRRRAFGIAGLAAAAALVGVWLVWPGAPDIVEPAPVYVPAELGVVDGGVTPSGPATVLPTVVPPMTIENDRISGDKNILPDPATKAEIRKAGKRVIASFKLCVDTDGHVTSVALLKSTHFPRYDDEIATAIKTWRYKPRANLICTAVTFVYEP